MIARRSFLNYVKKIFFKKNYKRKHIIFRVAFICLFHFKEQQLKRFLVYSSPICFHNSKPFSFEAKNIKLSSASAVIGRIVYSLSFHQSFWIYINLCVRFLWFMVVVESIACFLSINDALKSRFSQSCCGLKRLEKGINNRKRISSVWPTIFCVGY